MRLNRWTPSSPSGAATASHPSPSAIPAERRELLDRRRGPLEPRGKIRARGKAVIPQEGQDGLSWGMPGSRGARAWSKINPGGTSVPLFEPPVSLHC